MPEWAGGSLAGKLCSNVLSWLRSALVLLDMATPFPLHWCRSVLPTPKETVGCCHVRSHLDWSDIRRQRCSRRGGWVPARTLRVGSLSAAESGSAEGHSRSRPPGGETSNARSILDRGKAMAQRDRTAIGPARGSSACRSIQITAAPPGQASARQATIRRLLSRHPASEGRRK
jgi:hypothetical protein